ncbi:MAG TPA: D-2-hydroxyacid dehydrogenase [Abditibacteriaceae bacterium]|jgi:phosphoglycerate dehydrogenase-like enzyme
MMNTQPLSIWTNVSFPEPAMQLLRDGASGHKLIFARDLSTQDALAALREADVAFGQPDAATVMASARLRWAHITSAGYTPYDRDDLKAALRSRGAIVTNSSHVYDEPCAQHALAMMLADARQLLPAHEAQRTQRDWNSGGLRAGSYLLNGQTVLMLGYGAIAQRLAQLLAPFGARIVAVRRHPRGDEEIEIVAENGLESVLAQADHVVNILPDNASTRGYMNAQRLGLMKSGARFYNIGRGTTVDQDALVRVLESGALALAYLDVTDPEPLPREHPLWTAPNCTITPHTAGGHKGEFERLVQHFLDNLRLFEQGQPLRGQVI